ncbi:methyl-directed mismatch repair protein MutS [Erysipelotrichaceae bacterium]|nr:methyl-directed mismatch repair protein MutS [Erysipelotrichaceae bacterium]
MKKAEKKTPTYTPMMQQYLSLKEQYPDTLLFFRLGDFYEMFFEDAIKTSKMLEITLTSRASAGNDKIPMCGVPYHAAHGYIQKLVDLGEKIAIAEQTSEPQKGKTLVDREVVKIITPGTFVQEGTFQAAENCYVAACLKENDSYTVCYGDISVGNYFYMKGLKTTDEALDFLRVINAIELVVLEQHAEELAQIISYFEVQPTVVKQIIPTAYTINVEAQACFSLLETYLNTIRRDSMLSFQDVIEIKYETSMFMSAATVSSLEIFETIKTRSREGSLFSLLDQTKTALGTRKLRHWLTNPLLEATKIENRLDIVSNFMEHYIERLQLQKLLAKTYDLERLITRICSQTAQPRELHQLKQTLAAFEEIRKHIAESVFHPQIKRQLEKLANINEILEELQSALATEDIISLKDSGLFKHGYSQALDELKEISNGGSAWLLDLEKREKERTGIKNLRIKYNRVFGYFIEVSKGNAQLVKEEWGYHRKQTLTNAERFVTEELKQKEEQLLGANERLAQLEKQIFIELCDKIIPYRISLQKIADFIGLIDVLQAFAEVSQKNKYVRPAIGREQSMHIFQSRHPIIEKVTGEHFIPNDVDMLNDDILLITGPNMAGKSTYMRQVAICAIMQQIGCFIPASRAQLPIFDAIFTRIGAQDDLFSGESTFMVEMKEVSLALNQATNRSLLLFDEIGRGTATYDGLALAYAILDYIQGYIHAKTLFSTHYHELTELVGKMDRVRNIHVSATLKNDEIIFHHQIKEGSIERSYGVQVARLAKLPEIVIKEAKELLVVLEANHVEIDATIIESDHIQNTLKKQADFEKTMEQNQILLEKLAEIAAISAEDLSPKQAWKIIEKMQNDIQYMLK